MKIQAFILTLLSLSLGACDSGSSTSASNSSKNTEVTSVSDKSIPAADGPYFADIAASANLEFQHFIGATGEYLMTEVMGSGAALFDYDNDGDLDVYLIQGAMADARRDISESKFGKPAYPLSNRLFRNELVPHGDLLFTDVSDTSGLADTGYGMGVATGDIDNDGDTDIYVTNFGSNLLFKNNGDGSFTNMTASSGIDLPGWSTSAAFVDFDRDGDLDLYSVDYVMFDIERNTECTSTGGRRDYCGPQVFPPMADHLYRNDGNFRFTDISKDVQIDTVAGPGLGIVWADFDRDGWSDAFVANDGSANRLWLNSNGERFEDAGLRSGTAYNAMGGAEASMGVTAGDYDGDGDFDLFMTHLVKETNTLYINNGNARFYDGTDQAGLGASSLSRTGFGSRFFDFNNDGWLDLFIANGNVKLEESRVAVSDYPLEQANQLYLNNSGKFTDVSAHAGAEVNFLEVSRGAAFGDLDNDGGIDILLTNNNGPARLLHNTTKNRDAWISIVLTGTDSNRDAAGARVAIQKNGQCTLWRRVGSDGSYLSASDKRVHIGLGQPPQDAQTNKYNICVIWPNGNRELFSGIPATAEGDYGIELIEGTGALWRANDSNPPDEPAQ